METAPKVKVASKKYLLVYLIVSAMTFPLFVLADSAGISVLLFMVIQFAFLYRWVKPLIFIPFFIFGVNSFISANTMWRVPNFFVAILLYSATALWIKGQLPLKGSLLEFIFRTFKNILQPIYHFNMPAKWFFESRGTNVGIIKRVVIGVAISAPCLIFLLIMLSRADAIFSHVVSDSLWWLVSLLHFTTITRVIFGIVIGFYLFGMLVYITRVSHEESEGRVIKEKRGDLLIINIVLVSILIIYTLFVIIQFRYLFASSDNLPFGLTFESYARRGFFELMALTAINIALILITCWLSKDQRARLTKVLCFYLCAVTAVLLTSSFYRMWLHGSDDGLTRMRLLVFGFLIFKAIGILVTFVYISRPNFNIVAIYCLIALIYYLSLNIIPIDNIVAHSQVNKYFASGRAGMHYALTLSDDAAPQIARLLYSDNPYTSRGAEVFLASIGRPAGWRQWRISLWNYGFYTP